MATQTIRGKIPNLRRDTYGNEIYKPAYGTQGAKGWEVDHKTPRSKGGTNNPRNLQALQTLDNRKKNTYPYKCMSMKKLLTLATAVCSLTSVNAFADDNSWWRDADDYYKGWVDSSDSAFQAVLRPVGQQTGSSFVGLLLVTSHKEYCSDKSESFSDDLTMAVNDRKVTFKTSCYKNEWLNIRPTTEKANDYLLEQFNYYRNKNVRFVMTKSSGPDWVFTFPTKGFGKLYSSIKESVKEPIE